MRLRLRNPIRVLVMCCIILGMVLGCGRNEQQLLNDARKRARRLLANITGRAGLEAFEAK